MRIFNTRINDERKAEIIANGSKTFDIVEYQQEVMVGDCIHYILEEDGQIIKHDVSKYVYMITSVEKIHDMTVVSIKETVLWKSYVHDLVVKVCTKNIDCCITFYGDMVLSQCSVESYYGNKIHATDRVKYGGCTFSIDDIANISTL